MASSKIRALRPLLSGSGRWGAFLDARRYATSTTFFAQASESSSSARVSTVDKQGLIVLTDERLFFFEKSLLGQETVEEFSLKAITSVETQKKMGGERLVVTGSGNRSEIKGMIHGQADEIAREIRKLMHDRTLPQPHRRHPPATIPLLNLKSSQLFVTVGSSVRKSSTRRRAN